MNDYTPSSPEMDAMAEMLKGSKPEDLIRCFGGYHIPPRIEEEARKTMERGAAARDAGHKRDDCPYQYPYNMRRSWWTMGWIDRDRELSAEVADTIAPVGMR